MTQVVIWIYYIIFLALIIEFIAYFWHRIISHSDFIYNLHLIHGIHHQDSKDLDPLDSLDSDDLYDDFIQIKACLIIFEVCLGLFISIFPMFQRIGLITAIVAFVMFTWEWWIHTAYHDETHWLNTFEWFKQAKNLHFIHHEDTNRNFGIITHIYDIVFQTYDIDVKDLKDLTDVINLINLPQ